MALGVLLIVAGHAIAETAPQRAAVISCIGYVDAVAVSPDGGMVAMATSQLVEDRPVFFVLVWRSRDGTLIKTCAGAAGAVRALEFSPNGGLLAGQSAQVADSVYLWRVSDGELLHTYSGARSVTPCLSFSADSQTLAAGYMSAIQLLDTESFKPVAVLMGDGGNLCGTAFSPDGKRLAACANDGTVTMWNLEQRKPAREWSVTVPQARSITFAANGDTIAVVAGPPGSVRLFHSADGSLAVQLADAGNSVCAAGDQLLVWDDLGLTLWALPSRKVIRTVGTELEPMTAVSMPAPGCPLTWATARDRTVVVWRLFLN